MRTCSTVASATDYPQIGDDVCISPDGCVMPDAADTEARSRLGVAMRESRNFRPALRADYADERDTKRIRPDQERETANGNGEVDLMHGDLSERPQFDSFIH